ncbi:MAG: hypothetical protein AB9917_16750 [Negativicutes bacterium]
MKNNRSSIIMLIGIVSILNASIVCMAAAPSLKAVSLAGYQPGHQISLPGMPAFGKWMIDPRGTIAHWLGYRFQGKILQEPINVILVDEMAKSPEDAQIRLLKSCSSAGYDNQLNHSTGYSGFIGEKLYGQYPREENRAFSNTFFWMANNHGRVFGPHYFEGKYYFIAAFSREGIDMNTEVKHVYESFIVARDDFTKNLDEQSDYQIVGTVDMKNGVPDDPGRQTVGDHDGRAVVLKVGAPDRAMKK